MLYNIICILQQHDVSPYPTRQNAWCAERVNLQHNLIYSFFFTRALCIGTRNVVSVSPDGRHNSTRVGHCEVRICRTAERNKSDTRKKAVFLPEPEITFIYGGGLCIAGLLFLMACLFARRADFYFRRNLYENNGNLLERNGQYRSYGEGCRGGRGS